MAYHITRQEACLTLTQHGHCTQVKIEDSKLQIVQEGRTRKFKRKVFEKTFGGASVCGR